jgi:phosphatidylinositol glycan class Q protein
MGKFLGEMFLWLLHIWSGKNRKRIISLAFHSLLHFVEIIYQAFSFLPCLVRVFPLIGFCGASFMIAAFSDMIFMMSFHLFIFYSIAIRIYSFQLKYLISLFRLFRGKRRNVLRKRVDSCDYDLDQLLLGTILFTLLAFLFPTVFVYYVLFGGSRLIIVFVHAIVRLLLLFLNSFPIFSIGLRLFDPQRLSGNCLYFRKQILVVVLRGHRARYSFTWSQ